MQLRRQVALVVATALLAAVPAWAQNVSSRLTGTVKDAQGAVLPGVTVTATSPALIGSQVAVTETNGSYQFPSLPSGTYTLKFELAGFQPFTRQSINLGLGQTLSIDATLQLASLKETVQVTAESPIVDTQSTAVGNTMDTAKLIGVPSSSDLWGALAQSPGIRMQGFDVGGSHKSQQSGYNAFGITNQTRVVIEGVDTTEGTGGAGGYWDYFSQNEVAVSGAGQDVAMNTPGAAVISTIKSGGNQFKALGNQTYESGSFVGDNTNETIKSRGGSAAPNKIFWESHVDAGGPLLKDRLWFFAAYNHFKIDKVISGVPPTIATDLMTNNNFTNKETWKASSKDTLIGYYQWQKKAKPLRGLSSATPKESTLAQFSPGWMYNGRWERVWSNRLFSEINVGEFGYIFPMQPSVDYKTNPPRHDLATGVDSGAGWLTGSTTGPFSLGRAKPQIYGNATYYLPTKSAGSHDLKIGFEWINDMSNFASSGTSGPILYLDSNGATSEIRLTDLGDPSKLGSSWTIPGDDNKRMAIYFQDRWTANDKMTITAGVRYDRQAPYYTTGKRDPILTDFFSAKTFPQKTLFIRNNVAPRIGLSYDPKGDGKTAIKAFYGRYYFNFADSFSSVDPGGANWADYKFNDLNGNRLYDGPQEIGTKVASGGGVSTTLDGAIKVPYTDEFDLSYQRQFWGESSARVAYVRKMSREQFATYNISREGQFTVPTTVNVTLQSIDQGVTGTQAFTVNDIPSSLKGVVNNVIATMPAGVQNGAYNYDTIEFAFNKRFQKGLFVDSSFDYTWRDDLRNNTASTSPLTQSDAIGTGYYQNVFPTVPNRQKTTAWQFHLSSRYEFPYEIGVGANFNVQSGWEYARRITVTLPNSGSQSFWMTDLGANGQRSQVVPLLNIRVDKAFSFAGHRLTGMLDVFNLLNNAAITNFNVFNGARFNQVIQPLDPITVQLGVRFEF
ncbi:MAG: TonB-dependent receptor [Acidobacteriota bacterium]|nr:TonB-dependent receptor [Acidobacteriota bacterium]